MEKEKTYPLNDTYRDIGRVMDDLRAWESPRCNRVARAAILHRLKEAQFWALELIDSEETDFLTSLAEGPRAGRY